MRAEFEEWARRTHTRPGTSFDQSHNGVYKDNRIAAKWAAWQAAWPVALATAAAICDDQHHKWRWDNEPDSDSGPRTCARAIRASISGKTGEA